VTKDGLGNCWYYTGDNSNYYRVILEPANEGTYIFTYNSAQSKFPEKDLQDDLADAKRFCEQELGLSRDNWEEDTSIVRLMS
jgi:hypothetical protein